MAELEAARKASTFDVKKLKPLTVSLMSGQRDDVRRSLLLNIVLSETVFIKWKRERTFWSRNELMRNALILCKRIVELKFSLKLNRDEISYMFFLVDDLMPIHIHETLFIPYIQEQGSEDQVNYWLPLAQSYKIIGCYAQTELGHGSNVAALETTASFVPETDEWDLFSPSLTSTKWWIGGLGIIATHAIVMARLIIGSADYGIHAFIVPIRDQSSHHALPNVIVGDIGPKFGCNSKDNGFLRFNHVKIPRTNMLMRFAKVCRQGIFTPSIHPKLSYGGMMLLRVSFVNLGMIAMAKAATIAIRYTTVRRQFLPLDSSVGKELPVIQYQSVQSRLFPILAEAYGLGFTAHFLSYQHIMFTQLIRKFSSQSDSNDGTLTRLSKSMAELHLNSSCLKIIATDLAASGIEEARLSCGGHGYSAFSGFAEMYSKFVHLKTAEGDNFVLCGQVGRYLIKLYLSALSKIKKGTKTVEDFLQDFGLSKDLDFLILAATGVVPTVIIKQGDQSQFLKSSVQLDLFRFRVLGLVKYLADLVLKRMDETKNSNTSFALAHVIQFNLAQVYHLTNAYGEYLLVRKYISALDGPCLDPSKIDGYKSLQSSYILLSEPLKNTQPSLYQPLKHFLNIMALNWIEKHMVDYLRFGVLESFHLHMIHEIMNSPNGLLSSAIKYAVPLSDSFSIPDYVINSAIGAGDGRCYDRLWDMAVFGGKNSIQTSSEHDQTKNSTSVLSIPKGNLNLIYNRELYNDSMKSNLPNPFKEQANDLYTKYHQSVVKKSMVQHKQQLEDVGISFSGGNSPFMFDGDNDKENEEDKIGTAQMRDWQEFHALVLNPLISGQVYIKNSKL